MPTAAITFLGINGAIWLRLLFLISVGLFAWRMSQLIRILRLGRAEYRLNDIPLRIKTFLIEVMGQKRLFQEPVIGWAHPLIFWGFCLFCFASALLMLGGMFPSLSIPQAEEIPLFSSAIDIFAAIVLVALAAAAVRRYFYTPKGLERTGDATLILALIATLMITYLFAEAGAEPGKGLVWRPMGDLTAWALRGLHLSDGAMQTLGHTAWWIHAFVLLFFLAYLPYSKHMHLLWAPFGVFLAEIPKKGVLPPAVDEQDSSAAGPLSRFTWRMLYNAFSCAECGRCERVCPAAACGSQLSGKQLIHQFKIYVLEQGMAQLRGKNQNGKQLIGEMVSPQELWGCLTCYACMERCPVRNEHVPLIVELRRQLVENGDMNARLQEALTSLQRYGNSLGKSPRKRCDWTKNLSQPIKNALKEPVETLWFVGDYASFHPSSSRMTCMTAQLFQQAGLDFGILYDKEKSAGNDVRRTGEEGLFEILAEENAANIRQSGCKKIVTTDPHAYHALKREYSRFGLETPVFHYSELLAEWLKRGVLHPKQKLPGRAVYHDPCYLGRINGIFDAPRQVIDAIGLDRIELPRNRENSFCCGAGGGKIWMEEEEGMTERPAVNRIREALGMEGASLFVVACPKDYAMFEDALKTVGGEDRLRIADLSELVCKAMEVPREEVAAA
ncbi:MAG: (Fe-S)-binding protein [Candidatus Omnitrophota bacterium]